MFSASLCTKMWGNSTIITLKNAEHNISYSYDSGSVRVSKNVDGVESKYAYINGLLVYEIRGDMRFYYCYDANGILYSVNFTRYDGAGISTYYFSHNSRGDIIGIYNSLGTLEAKYEYDSWGNVLSITDANGNAITSATHIGNLNPFRYRGYYYDSESGLYYLMSRYYDPATHRFINADGYFQAGGDILDANMSAYCRNNPVNSADDTGTYTYKCDIHKDWWAPNCVICRPEYLTFLNSHVDWYNKTKGYQEWNKVVGFNKQGDEITQAQVDLSKGLSFGSTAINFNTGSVLNFAGTQGGAAFSAGCSATSYAFSTPLNIASHWTNPYLTNGQKWGATGLEVFFVFCGIGGAFLFGVGIGFFGMGVTGSVVNYWESKNKSEWGILE